VLALLVADMLYSASIACLNVPPASDLVVQDGSELNGWSFLQQVCFVCKIKIKMFQDVRD
jgi:hypothetical protein